MRIQWLPVVSFVVLLALSFGAVATAENLKMPHLGEAEFQISEG